MTLTLEAIEAEVRRLATADPDHVYTSGAFDEDNDDGRLRAVCYYTTTPTTWNGYPHTPAEACIFGQALANLGVSIEVLADCEGIAITAALAKLDAVMPPEDGRYARWFEGMQFAQDSGLTWAAAIEQADRLWPQPSV